MRGTRAARHTAPQWRQLWRAITARPGRLRAALCTCVNDILYLPQYRSIAIASHYIPTTYHWQLAASSVPTDIYYVMYGPVLRAPFRCSSPASPAPRLGAPPPTGGNLLIGGCRGWTRVCECIVADKGNNEFKMPHRTAAERAAAVPT
eukprot:scaffold6600_cov125-Isochrysis_galbana.AAC.3